MHLNSPATPKSGLSRLARRDSVLVYRAGSASSTVARVAAHAVVAAVVCFGFLGAATPAAANEVVTLADNTQVAGKLTHYYDGIIVMETSSGQKIELPRDKVKAITFKLPRPAPSSRPPRRPSSAGARRCKKAT